MLEGPHGLEARVLRETRESDDFLRRADAEVDGESFLFSWVVRRVGRKARHYGGNGRKQGVGRFWPAPARLYDPTASPGDRAIRPLLTLLALGAAAVLAAAEPRWEHGISFFGSFKYPPDFTHFDYVNPDAPKGGTLVPRHGP